MLTNNKKPRSNHKTVGEPSAAFLVLTGFQTVASTVSRNSTPVLQYKDPRERAPFGARAKVALAMVVTCQSSLRESGGARHEGTQGCCKLGRDKIHTFFKKHVQQQVRNHFPNPATRRLVRTGSSLRSVPRQRHSATHKNEKKEQREREGTGRKRNKAFQDEHPGSVLPSSCGRTQSRVFRSGVQKWHSSQLAQPLSHSNRLGQVHQSVEVRVGALIQSTTSGETLSIRPTAFLEALRVHGTVHHGTTEESKYVKAEHYAHANDLHANSGTQLNTCCCSGMLCDSLTEKSTRTRPSRESRDIL